MKITNLRKWDGMGTKSRRQREGNGGKEREKKGDRKEEKKEGRRYRIFSSEIALRKDTLPTPTPPIFQIFCFIHIINPILLVLINSPGQGVLEISLTTTHGPFPSSKWAIMSGLETASPIQREMNRIWLCLWARTTARFSLIS